MLKTFSPHMLDTENFGVVIGIIFLFSIVFSWKYHPLKVTCFPVSILF